MSQRKSDLSKEIKACTTTYPAVFVNSLPSSCQRMFTDKSMLQMMEQFQTGDFSSQSSNSSIVTVQPRAFQLTVITYYELDQNVQKTDEIIGKLNVLGLVALYSRDLHEKSVIGGFLTIMSAHCSPQQLGRPVIKKTFESRGYDIQARKITLQELDRYFMQQLNPFVTYSSVQRYHRDFYKIATAIGFSTLLFFGKSIASESFDKYLDGKWQILASHVGCEKFIARKPNDRSCNYIHLFFSNCNRADFFELYRLLSKQQNHKFMTAFGFIVESLKWADMEYIHLIDKYIVKANPELLSMFQFQSFFGSEKARMKHVYKLMELLPQSDHPFLKLLLPYNRLTVITRKNFKFLHGTARAIASIDDHSISYIDDHEDTFHVIDMKNQIKNYVLMKKNSTLNKKM